MASHTQIDLDNVTAIWSAKESFLKNTYLMSMTISYLPEGIPFYLLNAALTCKDFLDVALDALWEEMCSWEPLLRLLPTLQLEDDSYV